MHPEVKIRLVGDRLSIRQASLIPAEQLAEIQQNADIARRLVAAAGLYSPALVLEEFIGDLADITRFTDEQLRQAVQDAALWHRWSPVRSPDVGEAEHNVISKETAHDQ